MGRKLSIEEFEYNPKTPKDKKHKISDICFNLITYISLIPTVTYNILWIYFIGSALIHIQEENIQTCKEIVIWTKYAFIWSIIATIKACFFLCFVQYCCGNENDCSFFCLLVKSITSFIPSLIFLFKMPYTLNPSKLSTSECEHISLLNYYYINFEYSYVIFFLSIICLIPLGAILVGLKEAWRSRKYKLE